MLNASLDDFGRLEVQSCESEVGKNNDHNYDNYYDA
jgi:hypothetical protein